MSTVATGGAGESTERRLPTRRDFLAAAGGALSIGLTGCTGSDGPGSTTGRGSGEGPIGVTQTPIPGGLAEILTSNGGGWYQDSLGESVSFGVGAPAATSAAYWQFERIENMTNGYLGVGSRDSTTRGANGFDVRPRLPGLGNFAWRLEGSILVADFNSQTLSKRTERWQLTYDRASDQFTVHNPEFGRGTWVRTGHAFRTNPRFGGGENYEAFSTVPGPNGFFFVDLPTSWNNVQTGQLDNGAFALVAAPGGQTYGQLGVPGTVILLLTQAFDPVAVLESNRARTNACDVTAIQVWSNTAVPARPLNGRLYRYDACQGGTATLLNAAAVPSNNRYTVVLTVIVQDARDNQAAQRILDSLQVLYL